MVGIIPEKAGEYAYFLKRGEAQEWAEKTIKLNKEVLKLEMEAVIIKINVTLCSCGNLTEETECLRCQDIREDAQLDAYYEKCRGKNGKE